MDSPNLRRLLDLVGDALERPDAERAAWLEAECRGDSALLAEARSLLAEAAATSLQEITARLQAPVVRAAAAALAEDDNARGPEGARAGARVGAYRLIRELGHGGMGTVYLAERDDDAYRARVAIKFVRGRLAVPELERRFRAERQILADLNHRNIARLLDGGTASDGTPYFVMEYLEGEPIDAWCERQGIGARARIELFLQVCDAVAYAHRSGVIHRDLKPANILVTADGTPKLLDFGIAKLLGDAGEAAQTGSLLIMTPTYASPEQVRGEPVSTATDVYSLGVVLYELLAGHAPFDLKRASFSEVEHVICDVEPAPVSQTAVRTAAWRRDLSGPLEEIVHRALHKQPARRHVSVDALAEELRRCLMSPPRGRVAVLRDRARRLVRRPAFSIAIGAVAVVAALTVVIARQRAAAAPAPLGGFEFLAAQNASAALPSPARVYTADVNGDGRADLIWNHVGAASNETRVALANGDGTFAFHPPFAYPQAATASWEDTRLAIGDFNGDGAADLAWYTFAQREKHTYVALSNRDGSFRFLDPQVDPPRWGGAWYAHVADANGDGRADMIFNSLSEDNLTRVLHSKGDGTFEEVHGAIHIAHGWSQYTGYPADVDGDGRPDLIWNDVPGGMNRTYVARSLESLELLPWQDHPAAPDADPGRSRWSSFTTHTGDVDGDGRADLVWIATERDPIVIYRAIGQPTALFRFPDAQTVPRPHEARQLNTVTGDFNGDGRTDLLMAELARDADLFWILLGTPGGSFTAPTDAYRRPVAPGEGVNRSPLDLLVMDVDGDRRSDIVWSSRPGSRVFVARSRAPR